MRRVVVGVPGEAAAVVQQQVALLFVALHFAVCGEDEAVAAVGFVAGDEEVAQLAAFDGAGVDDGAVVQAAVGVGGKEDHARFLLCLLAQRFLAAIDARQHAHAEREQEQADGDGAGKQGAGLVARGDAAGERGADFVVAVEAAEGHDGGEDEGERHEDDEEAHRLQADEHPYGRERHVAGSGGGEQSGKAEAQEDCQQYQVGSEEDGKGFADEVAVEDGHGRGEFVLCYRALSAPVSV